jgi:glycosyltransferase involved in cell wall biosynthesis
MVIVVEPLLHLPGHFKTYTSRLLTGFCAGNVDSLVLLGTFSTDAEVIKFQDISKNLQVLREKPLHPFFSTFICAFKLLLNPRYQRLDFIYFLDYHFVSMALIYPLLAWRFKNIVITHPGTTIPPGALKFSRKLKIYTTYLFAKIIGRVAKFQVYHSPSVREEFFNPLNPHAKASVIEWGVIKSSNPYPFEANKALIENRIIRIIGFGRLEKRKGVSAFIKWIDSQTLSKKYKIHITLLGTVDTFYQQELEEVISQCKNIAIDLRNYIFTDQELQVEINKSHFALLAYDKSFTAASGVMSDIVGYGLPILTCDDCVFSDRIKKLEIGYSIKYDSIQSNSIEEFVKFFSDYAWLKKIENLSCNTWSEVANKHLKICS